MFIRRPLVAALLVACTVASVAVASPPVFAQEPLRWKFKVGERLAYDSEQDMTIGVKGVEGGNFEMRTEQQLNLIWEVVSVNELGEARIRQKLDRVRTRISGPAKGAPANEAVRKNESVEYDSQAKDPPVGEAAMAAAMFEPMMQGVFEFTLTPRGEVKDVKVPEPVLEMIKKNPEAAQMNLATDAGIQKMLMQEIVVLPEAAPKAGESWSSKMQMPIPVVGKQTIETTYTYQGTKEVDGKQQAAIETKRMVQYDKPQDQLVVVTIKEQTSDGETLFNITDGRLSSATLNQLITIEAANAASSIVQKLDQKSKVTVRPADASAPSQQPAP